ncbi:MAG: sensor domain-containing phosphodiesterase, partial [Paracraurococcus sp.]
MSDPLPPGWTETERLEALHRTDLLDTPSEDSFDDLARLAAELLGAPMAALQLVAEIRPWSKATFGFA